MSVLGRLFRREGTSKLEWTSTTSKTAPPTFVPELIREKTWTLTDRDHLHKVATKDPVAKYIVYGRAEACFDDWFTFKDKDGEEVLQEAQRQLKMLNAKRVFTQTLAMAKEQGNSWTYTGKNRFIPESGEGGVIATLAAYDPRTASVFEYYSDVDEEVKSGKKRPGDPKTMKLEIDVGRGGGIQQEVLYLPASDFIPLCPRPIGRGYTGRSELEPAWDMLTYLRLEFHAMTFYDIKIGHGLFAAFTQAGFSSDTIDKWQTAFEDVSIKRALVIDSGQVERIEFIGPKGQATNFEGHIDACMQMVAIAVEIPVELMKGALAGATTGSETNLKLSEIVERKDQKIVEELIRETVRRMGFNDTDYDIDWNVKYAQNEEERAKIEQTHAQAMTTKLAYMTIDEIRSQDGLPPLPDGRGDRLAGEQADFSIDVQGLKGPDGQDPDAEEKTNNPGGKQL